MSRMREPKIYTSDEELAEVTLGEPDVINSSILLVESDPHWPLLFEQERSRIVKVLGSCALAVEHVGSTSVKALPAKPIIDILLVVEDSNAEEDYLPQMEQAGYRLRIREPDWFAHRMFKGPDTDINLHVFSRGCEEIERMLAFRNWLRQNEQDRNLYAETKRTLAQKKWKYVQNYADAKSTVVLEIMARALKVY